MPRTRSFSFNDPASTEIYTLSLHDALPISANLTLPQAALLAGIPADPTGSDPVDRKSTRLNSSHSQISYAVFCLKKKNLRIEAAFGVQVRIRLVAGVGCLAPSAAVMTGEAL